MPGNVQRQKRSSFKRFPAWATPNINADDQTGSGNGRQCIPGKEGANLGQGRGRPHPGGKARRRRVIRGCRQGDAEPVPPGGVEAMASAWQVGRPNSGSKRDATFSCSDIVWRPFRLPTRGTRFAPCICPVIIHLRHRRLTPAAGTVLRCRGWTFAAQTRQRRAVPTARTSTMVCQVNDHPNQHGSHRAVQRRASPVWVSEAGVPFAVSICCNAASIHHCVSPSAISRARRRAMEARSGCNANARTAAPRRA